MALYAFDGTGNHQNPLTEYVDYSWFSVRWAKEINYKTNVRLFYDAYNEKVNGMKFYVPGIGSGYEPDGTEYNVMSKQGSMAYEGATGNTMWARAEYMKGKLEEQLLAGDNVVDLVGFSRGAATGLVFLNMIADEVAKGNKLYDIEIRFVGLFDAVSSMRGLKGDDKSLTNGSKWFRLPESYKLKYKNTPIHAISMDEQRSEFQQIDLEGAKQVGFRGVHSNVGGGYGPNDPFAWHAFDYMTGEAYATGINFNKGALEGVARPGEANYNK